MAKHTRSTQCGGRGLMPVTAPTGRWLGGPRCRQTRDGDLSPLGLAVPLGVATSHDEQQAQQHHQGHDEFVSPVWASTISASLLGPGRRADWWSAPGPVQLRRLGERRWQVSDLSLLMAFSSYSTSRLQSHSTVRGQAPSPAARGPVGGHAGRRSSSASAPSWRAPPPAAGLTGGAVLPE